MKKGIEIVQTLARMAQADESISDVTIMTDRAVFLQKAEGSIIIDEWGRLGTAEVRGVLAALYSNRRNASLNPETRQKEINELIDRLHHKKEIDFSCQSSISSDIKGAHLRVQAYWQATGLGLTGRFQPETIPKIHELGLREDIIKALKEDILKKNGLMLITGATGSGKSTTIAALLDWVRHEHPRPIVTVEDPIEYHFSDTMASEREGEDRVLCKSPMIQQEVGRDVLSYTQGLKSALRKRPAIIVLGEIRDEETMQICLEASQTGHLILATMHSRGAPKTLGRILEFFPQDRAMPICQRMSESIVSLITQGLLPAEPNVGSPYVVCTEYLRNGTQQTRSAITAYHKESAPLAGVMNQPPNCEWDKELKRLVDEGKISEETYQSYIMTISSEDEAAVAETLRR